VGAGVSSGAALPSPDFWRGRRVLVTGHTGFKGSWLSCWLRELGAEVMGVSLPQPPTQPSLWEQLGPIGVAEVHADIGTSEWVPAAAEFDPHLVLHLAAQPLVSVGHERPGHTFSTNVIGTARVLEALPRFASAGVALVVTTDKVYEPTGAGPHREDHRLGGRDPYAASKAAAELVVSSWPETKARTATARAGNVIGGGDWAGDRLVPDLVRSWRAGRPVELRNPGGVRPWQHVLEPLRGYLVYVEALAGGADLPPALNFGPADRQAVTVADVVEQAGAVWSERVGSLPSPAAAVAASARYAETAELTLDSAAAAAALDWSSLLDWRIAVEMTIAWYAEAQSRPAADLVSEQLARYTSLIGGLRAR
jgi:CDP-glucose 4,6-dehydratase